MLVVYADFDGTIATRDVGYELFKSYAGPAVDSYVQEWMNDAYDSRELLRRECASTRISLEEFNAFVETHALDAAFLPFYEWCRRHRIPLEILSDGLDAYIARLLAKYELHDIPFQANHLTFLDDNRIDISFPHYDPSCSSSANCKGQYLRRHDRETTTIVYIGDGYSDRCAIPYADMLFAKHSLREYCEKEHIDYYPFQDFQDVLRLLQQKMNLK